MIIAQVSWTRIKSDVSQQPATCLLTRISPFTFLQAALGAKTRPICTFLHSAQMCARARRGEAEGGGDGAVFLCAWAAPRWAVITRWHREHCTAAGEPLSGEPSFPSVSNSQWHLFRAARRPLRMPRARGEGEAGFLDVGGQVGAGLNRSHVRVGAATQVVFHGGVIKLSYGDFIELLKAADVTQHIFQ